jgi:sugar lactone lactonase YvrE
MKPCLAAERKPVAPSMLGAVLQRPLAVGGALLILLGGTAVARADWLYLSEGNRLRRIDLATLDGGKLRQEVLIDAASPRGDASPAPHAPPDQRRDVNGKVCFLPDGSGRFVVGEDTGQPEPPPGWGVFSARGIQVGKLTPTYRIPIGEPHGCVFDAQGRLFTSSVGNRGFGRSLGQLILWFPPYAPEPSARARPEAPAANGAFCKLATDIGTAGSVVADADGRIYIASSSRFAIYRFTPPFPTRPDAAGGCGARDETGAPRASELKREVFARGLYTYSGLAFAPNGDLYAASVFTGEIVEYDREGRRVRAILEPDGWLPPFATGNPQGLAVDAAGDLYYADLDLVWNGLGIGPGPNGKLRRIRFDSEGNPLAPDVLLDGLAFPDGVTVRRDR